MKKILFNIREFAWTIADEIADWLYPYRNRLTPEERFEVRVKDPHTEEMYICLLYTSPSPRDKTQ